MAYLEDVEHSDYANVRLHIATCGQCRTTLQRLTDLQHNLRRSGPYHNRLAGSSDELIDTLRRQTIERYVDGELPKAEAEPIKQLLQSDPMALKAALHYASHCATDGHLRSAQSLERAPDSANTPAVQPTLARLKQLLQQWLDLRPPVWISVPATVAAVLLVTLMVMPHWKSAQDYTVAAYQDKAVIHFQGANQLPGIGFFNKAMRSTQAFGPMEIRYNDSKRLSLRWPTVTNATSYHLTVFLISEGQKITVQELNTNESEAVLAEFRAEPGKRYEWTLNGETTDDKSFYTSGGFVINTPGYASE